MNFFLMQKLFLIIFVNILFIKWITSRRVAFLKNEYGFDSDVSEINLTYQKFFLTFGMKIKEDIKNMYFHADVTVYPFGEKGHALKLVNYTGSFCTIQNAVKKNFLIKEFFESFSRTTNLSISCPVPAGYYVIDNYHLETRTLSIPKSVPDVDYFADLSLLCQNKFGDPRRVIWTKTWGKIVD